MWLLSFLQITFGLLFSLFIPGFLLTLILFKDQDWLERVGCSIFFSLSISLFLALFLSLPIFKTIGNLSFINLAVSFLIITLILITLKKEKFSLFSNLALSNLLKLIKLPREMFLVLIIQCLLLIYIKSLSYLSLPSYIFHIIYLGGITAILYSLFSKKLSINQKLFLIVFWVISLQLITSFRQPVGIVSNYPDMLYELQIINYIQEYNLFSFNFQTTEQATAYKYNPGLELIIALISYFGINVEFILKYFFILTNTLTLTFLFLFFKEFINEDQALFSTLLAGSCFWFIHFESFTNHQSLAILSFVVLLFSLTKPSRRYYFLSLISIILTIISHHFSSVIMPLILSLAWLFSSFIKFKKEDCSKSILRYSILILFIIFSISWIIFSNLSILKELTNIIASSSHFTKESTLFLLNNLNDYSLSESFNNSLNIDIEEINTSLSIENLSLAKPRPHIKFVLLPTLAPTKPLTIILIAYLGVALFGVYSLFSLIFIFKRKEYLKLYSLVLLALASLFLSILFVVLWSFGLYKSSILDLFNRQFIYFYFFMSPLIAYNLFKLKNKYLLGALMFLMLISAVYQGTPTFFYDNSKKILDSQDTRLDLIKWKTLGIYLKEIQIEDKIWGDKLTFSFIGSYSRKEIQMFYSSAKLKDWKLLKKETYLALRESLVNISNSNNMIISDLSELKSDNDLIYSTGEVFLIQKI